MKVRLTLYNDTFNAENYYSFGGQVGLLSIIGIMALTMSFVFLPVLISGLLFIAAGLALGWQLSRITTDDFPAKEVVGYIEISTQVINIKSRYEDTHILLSEIAVIEIISNYYEGKPIDDEGSWSGNMQIKLKLKNSTTLTKQCLVEDKKQFNTLIEILKEWYKQKASIKEYSTHHKLMAILLQSHFSYKEIAAIKAELGIS